MIDSLAVAEAEPFIFIFPLKLNAQIPPIGSDLGRHGGISCSYNALGMLL